MLKTLRQGFVSESQCSKLVLNAAPHVVPKKLPFLLHYFDHVFKWKYSYSLINEHHLIMLFSSTLPF